MAQNLLSHNLDNFSHADGGQMNFYLNYYKNNETGEYDTFVEYTIGGLDNGIFVSKCLLELPKIDELKQLIEEDMKG